MSGFVILVSIMLVLTYRKSRRKTGASPICGVIGSGARSREVIFSRIQTADENGLDPYR